MFIFLTGAQCQTLSDSVVFKPEAEREFLEAMKAFQAAHFDTASIIFSHIIINYPGGHRATGAFIMAAKAFYELKDYKESIRLLKNMIDMYPSSTYIDDAHYTLALDYFRTGRYEDAAAECIIVLQTSHEKQLLARSEKLAEMLTSSYLTLPELQRLQSDAKSDEMKSLVTIGIAEKLLRTGDIAATEAMLHKIALLSPKIKYVSDALSLLEQIENRGMKIGVVLPLMLKATSPSTREMGLEFLEGIQLAINEYNQKVPLKVLLRFVILKEMQA